MIIYNKRKLYMLEHFSHIHDVFKSNYSFLFKRLDKEENQNKNYNVR